MNAFEKRFFVCIALVFLVFTAISFEKINLICFPVFLLLLAIFYFIFSKRRGKSKNLKLVTALLIAAAILGIGASNALIIKNDRMVEKYSGEHDISGYVVETSSIHSFMCEYVVHIEELDGKRVNFDMVLVSDYQCELFDGDFFRLRGRIAPIDSYADAIYLKNNNEHDYPLVCEIDDKTEINFCDKELRVSLMLSNLNSRLSAVLNAVLGKESGSLASALLLGNRELLSDSTLRDFKRAGVYHMLALSGMHVAILIGILDWLLKKLLTPRGVRIVALTLASLFYIALTGFTLSACRSMLMLWVMYLSLMLGKNRDVMTSLFLAVSVIVLISPASVLDLGLQLSFLSTFGVICATVIAEKIGLRKKRSGKVGIRSVCLSIVRNLALLLLSSLCVFTVTLPIITVYFGEVSLATFISNIFMGVVCEIFMVLSLLTLLLSGSPYLRIPFAELSAFVGEGMNAMVSHVSNIEGVMLSLNYPLMEVLVCGLFISFLILLALKIKRRWLILVPSIAFAILTCINVACFSNARGDFNRVEYVCADELVFSNDDEVYICDASDGSFGDLYEGVELARKNCFTEIDGIILTHYHSDHIVSIERLVKSYKIRKVLLPIPQNSNEDLIMRAIVRVLNDNGVLAYVYENERELDILDGKLYITPRVYSAEFSHPSIGVSFAVGGERVTLIGSPYFDSYLEASGMLEKYIKESDFLIFGSDGRAAKENFEIFGLIKAECEISFSSFDTMDISDFEAYMDKYQIYFDVGYKKYDLK